MKKIVLLVVIFVSISMVSCLQKKDEKSKIITYKVTAPIIKDTLSKIEYVADIQSIQNVEIRNKVKGYVEKIYVDEGQMVHSGQLLFKINNKSFWHDFLKSKAALKTAYAEAKIAALEVKNIRNLAKNKIVSQSEFEKAEATLESMNAKVEQVKSEVEIAKMYLSLTEIKSPFDGIIHRIPFKRGSLIDEGTLLTTISNNKEVFAYFNVSEKEYLEYKKGAIKNRIVRLLLANNETHPYVGKIETIDGEFDKSTGNIAFRARFDNPYLLLKHSASGKIVIQNKLNKALLIPQKSVFEIQDKLFVYVVEKGVLKTRNITIKSRLNHLYVVENGLNTKDKIIYEGIQNLKEGDRVDSEFIPLTKIISELNSKSNSN
jgi:RND family efflux transporter MFP subunit